MIPTFDCKDVMEELYKRSYRIAKYKIENNIMDTPGYKQGSYPEHDIESGMGYYAFAELFGYTLAEEFWEGKGRVEYFIPNIKVETRPHHVPLYLIIHKKFKPNDTIVLAARDKTIISIMGHIKAEVARDIGFWGQGPPGFPPLRGAYKHWVHQKDLHEYEKHELRSLIETR